MSEPGDHHLDSGEPESPSRTETDPLVGSGNVEPAPPVQQAAALPDGEVAAPTPTSVTPGSPPAPPGDLGAASVGSPEPPPGEPPGWAAPAPVSPWAPPGTSARSPAAAATHATPPPLPWTPPAVATAAPGAGGAPPGWGATSAPVQDPVVEHAWGPPAAPPVTAPPGSEPPAAGTGSGSGSPGRGSARAALIGALVGALVAALVTAGAFVAFGRDHDSSSSDGTIRPASVIVRDGDIQAILRKVQPTVVRIDVNGLDGQGTGTGFIVSSTGIIVTNAHVAANASTIDVTLSDNKTHKTASVLGIDPTHDLAVIKISGSNYPVAELGDSGALEVGDSVVAIGNALALEGTPTVTSGIVSALNRTISTGDSLGSNEPNVTLDNVIQTDAAINPGNSGGPLVDASGKVIGINTAIASPAEANNIGFAIAISSAKPYLDELETGKNAPAQTAVLGVTVQTVDPTANSSQGLTVDHGALVDQVLSDSAAQAAGIKVGDVIVQFDGTAIGTASQLTQVVRAHKPGDKVAIVVNRGGASRTLHAVLGGRSA